MCLIVSVQLGEVLLKTLGELSEAGSSGGGLMREAVGLPICK